jgi:hypothetical protein
MAREKMAYRCVAVWADGRTVEQTRPAHVSASAALRAYKRFLASIGEQGYRFIFMEQVID